MGKILDVFTKSYKEETEYREFIDGMIDSFKLNNKSESIEDKVKRLKEIGYVSNFEIKVGKY